MQTGILITNNGTHSAEDWGYSSASMLLIALEVDPNSASATKIEMAKDAIRGPLAKVFEKHHDAIISFEKQKLASGDHTRLTANLDATEATDIEQGVKDIMDVIRPLLAQFTKDPAASEAEVVNHIRSRLHMDLRTAQQVERSWHADKNPSLDESKKFRATFHPGAGV